MDDDERDKKRGRLRRPGAFLRSYAIDATRVDQTRPWVVYFWILSAFRARVATRYISRAGKKKRARKRDESPPPSKRQAVGSKQRPKRRSPSPVPPTDDEVETEAQKKERCARGVPRRCLHFHTSHLRE